MCIRDSLITDIEPAAAYNGVRPTGQTLIGDAESAFFAISSRGRLDETNDVVLAENIEVAVGVRDGALPYAAVAPDHLAAGELEAGENRVVVTVDVAVHQDHTAVVVPHVAGEVDLLRADLITRSPQSQ